MVSNEISIREYCLGDEEAIVSLFKKGFGSWPRFDLECAPVDHWLWKFRDNPFQRSIVLVAELSGRIVGCTTGLYSNVEISGEAYLCSPGTDSTVDADYRNKGILGKLHSQKRAMWEKEAVALSYGVSTNKYVLKTWAREGRFNFLSMVHLIRVRDVDKFVDHIQNQGELSRLSAKVGVSLSRLWVKMLRRRKQGKSTVVEVVDVDCFDESIDEFWNRLKKDYSFICERSARFLNWRYRDSRGGRYVVKAAREAGDLVGYIVLRVNRFNTDNPAGFIVDVCTFKGKSDVARILYDEAMSFFDSADVNVVNYCGVRGNWLAELLGEYGFFDSRHVIHVGCTGVSLRPEFLKQFLADDVLFHYGDFDWI
jgi:hypothetical protein